MIFLVVQSFFFESIDGDRVYSADQFSRHLRTLSLNGVSSGFEEELEVIAGAGMSVDVLEGRGWVQGRFFVVRDDPENLEVSDGDGDYDRIDTVVARMDRSTAVREIVLDIIEGTPAPSPAPPLLTESSMIWELPLANIYVEANETTSIVNEDITDRREISHHSNFESLLIDHNMPESGKARISTSVDLPENVWVTIEWDEVFFDNNNFFSEENPEVITINTGGLYLIQYSWYNFLGSLVGAQEFRINLVLNGFEKEFDYQYRTDSGGRFAGTFSRIEMLNEGDEIEIRVSDSNGGSLTATFFGDNNPEPNHITLVNLSYGQGDITDKLAILNS